jgi:FMN phosphatase YigB (HAD superfamily)
MTTLIKKAVFDEIGHFDEKMAIEDWDMWLRIAKRYHFAYSRNIFGKYRIHDKNTVHSLVKHYQEIRYRTLVKHATDNAEVRKQVLDIARGMYYTSDPAAKEVLKDFRERFGIVSMEYLLSKYHIPHSVPTLFIVIWRKLCHKRP